MKHNDDKYLEDEVKPLEIFDHPGLVRMLDFGKNGVMTKYPDGETSLVNYVILELAVNGELYQFIPGFGGLSERIS